VTGRTLTSARTVLWHAAFLVVSVLFGITVRQQAIGRGQESQASLNQWDHILGFLLEPYFIAYFLLPVWLFTSCVAIHRHFAIPALIRLGSYRSWLRSSILGAVRRLIPLMLIWLVSALLTSIGLPYEWGWSSASTTPTESKQILDVVSVQGLPPLAVLTIQLGLFTVTLIGCHAALAAVHLIAKRRYVTFLGAALVFFSLLYSFRNSFGFAPLDFANFFLLHRAFDAYDPIALVFVPVLVAVALCFAAARYADRQGDARLKLPVRWPLLVYLALCLLGILYAWVYKLQPSNSPTDLLFVAFYGVSAGGYTWMLYLFHSIVFLGFAYLFQLGLTEELDARIYYVALRRGSPVRWLAHFILPVAGRAPILLASLVAVTSVVALLGNLTGSNNAITEGIPDPGWVLYQFFVNGTLQLLCYVLITFIVSWVSGRTVAGLFALGALLVLSLPALNVGQLLPAALNSMGYLELGASELVRITVVLSIYLVVLTVITTLVVGNRRLFFNERI